MKLKIKKINNGFSLVELMVSISIFVLITSLTLANYPKFGNKLSLDLLAEDIALSFRQAQIFGSSVVGTKSAGPAAFGAYGLHFEAPEAGSYNYPYLLFADIRKRGSITNQYDGPSAFIFDPVNGPNCPANTESQIQSNGPNECLERFLISGFNQVKFLCKDFEKGGEDYDARVRACELANKKTSVLVLEVLFRRPNLDANFAVREQIGSLTEASDISTIGIVLESPGGDYTKTVVVWKTGQISVE